MAGVAKVLHAEGEGFAHGLAENVAAQVLALAGNYSHILFAATAFGKNIAPRVAARLDVGSSLDALVHVDGLASKGRGCKESLSHMAAEALTLAHRGPT